MSQSSAAVNGTIGGDTIFHTGASQSQGLTGNTALILAALGVALLLGVFFLNSRK